MSAGILLDPAQDTNGVLALPAVARMHEPIGDIARGREDQQAFGVQIQAPHGNPARAARFGKTLKDQGTLFRIIAGHHLARGLVIQQHPGYRTGWFTAQWPSIDPDQVLRTNPLPDMRGLAIDRNPTRQD